MKATLEVLRARLVRLAAGHAAALRRRAIAVIDRPRLRRATQDAAIRTLRALRTHCSLEAARLFVLAHPELHRPGIVAGIVVLALLAHAAGSTSPPLAPAAASEAVVALDGPAPTAPALAVEPIETHDDAAWEACLDAARGVASGCGTPEDAAGAASDEPPPLALGTEPEEPAPLAVAATLSRPPAPAAAPAPAAPAVQAEPPAPAATVGDRASAAAAFKAVNAARRRAGLPSFTPNAVLQFAAERYAAFLLDRGVIDHYLDGEPWTRAARAGYPSPLVGEVLALYATSEPLDSTADAQRLVDAWMNSPGHRDALLSKDFPFSEAGFGCAVGRDIEGRNVVICAGLVGVP